MKGDTRFVHQYCSKCKSWHLDGSVQVGLLPAVVQQTCDGDAVRQVVDEGDVVDQVVCFSDAEDDNGGSALKNTTGPDDVRNIKGAIHQSNISQLLLGARGVPRPRDIYNLSAVFWVYSGVSARVDVLGKPPTLSLECHL